MWVCTCHVVYVDDRKDEETVGKEMIILIIALRGDDRESLKGAPILL